MVDSLRFYSKSHRGLSVSPFTSSTRWISSINLNTLTCNEHFFLFCFSFARSLAHFLVSHCVCVCLFRFYSIFSAFHLIWNMTVTIVSGRWYFPYTISSLTASVSLFNSPRWWLKINFTASLREMLNHCVWNICEQMNFTVNRPCPRVCARDRA